MRLVECTQLKEGVCVCVRNHKAPGSVAYRLKPAPVKIRILYPLLHCTRLCPIVMLSLSPPPFSFALFRLCSVFN